MTSSAIRKKPNEQAQDEDNASMHPHWRWRTFPVFFAFVCGLLVASFVNGQPDNAAGAALQIAAILGLGYSLAHLFVFNVIVSGRMRRRRQAPGRDEAVDDWVDEVVHPDE